MGNRREPFEPGRFFHVYNHGNGDDNVFRCDENYNYFLRKYSEHIQPIAETYAYCLMPNHFHFAVKIKSERELMEVFKSKFKDQQSTQNHAGQNLPGLITRKFGNFLNGYVKAFNKMYDRRGSLFLDNIRRKKVKDADYMIKLIHYIHYNPVHHGFVDNMADWEYSSYHAFQMPNKRTRLNREEVLKWFNGKNTFEEIHQQKPELEF